MKRRIATQYHRNLLRQITPLYGVWASDPYWSPPADGQPVSSWRNEAKPGSNDFVQASAPNQPTFDVDGMNGHPAVLFNRTAQQHLTVTGIQTRPFKMLVVVKFAAVGNTEKFLGRGGVATQGVGKTSANAWSATLAGGATSIGGTVAANTVYVMRATVAGVFTAGLTTMWVNSTRIVTGNSGNASLGSPIVLGRDTSSVSGNAFGGHMSFLAIYSPLTLDNDLIELEQDLTDFYA